jgi:hypothetical protein
VLSSGLLTGPFGAGLHDVVSIDLRDEGRSHPEHLGNRHHGGTQHLSERLVERVAFASCVVDGP